ncbi:hypothetical protein A2477_01575 [Candidatus Falkowbacteria bacterium RIFOXYC2_FULL_47_12]|uniref:3D domain-containing protein n=2 Tax=Candidatus Falkowiibacteriota TaxID=1752728 RepID=A0A1F5TMX9_9BACT|nr:MAG: hypothetical protein A2242_01210 [Candidatus Falkowbacteria bacterium RIFOXYA2_FULL_47_9]OGF40236.1 MAG: hypothetical protein A2477_01575 [Candidatus Falkowbacteria bacterium RIFOXYC2_FULL_47_12]
MYFFHSQSTKEANIGEDIFNIAEKGAKKQKILFELSTDAFFTGQKLKMSKKLMGALIIVIAFQFVGFATPSLAQNSILEARAPENGMLLSNGALVTEREAELLQKGLVIIEKQPEIVAPKDNFSVATAAAQSEPVTIDSQASSNGQFVSWGVRTITSYNSEAGQTDDSPCITANGFNVCEHGIEDTIAANFLKFGTKVRMPALFGDRVFMVRDRMNERYSDRVDVWMVNKADSKAFGVRRAEIQVLIE